MWEKKNVRNRTSSRKRQRQRRRRRRHDEKENQFICYWNVLRMTQPSSLVVLQHWIRAYGRTAEFQWFYGCYCTHTYAYMHNRAHTCSQATLARIRVTQMCYSFILHRFRALSAIHISVAVNGYDSGIRHCYSTLCITSDCEHILYAIRSKWTNERTSVQKKNAKIDDSSCIFYNTEFVVPRPKPDGRSLLLNVTY